MKAIVKNGRLTLDEPSVLPEGTEVDLRVCSPATIAPEAVVFLDEELQPAIRTLYRLWDAVDGGKAGHIAVHQEQLIRDLDGVRKVVQASHEGVSEARRRLEAMKPSSMCPQDLTGLELTLFTARLPQPPQNEYVPTSPD
jgi:hypothetical protein